MRYASRAGWDPAGIPRMLTTLGRIEETQRQQGRAELAADAPAAARIASQRVQAAVREAEAGAHEASATDRDGYLRRIDGIICGDSPEQGIVRGSSFLHRRCASRSSFPTAGRFRTARRKWPRRSRTAKSLMRARADSPSAPGGRIEDTAIITMQSAGFRQVDGGPTTINGLRRPSWAPMRGRCRVSDACRLRALIRPERSQHVPGGRPSRRSTGIRTHGGDLQQKPRIVPCDCRRQTPSVCSPIASICTPREQGDTWQAIAEQQSKGLIKPTTLAIMNGHRRQRSAAARRAAEDRRRR